MSESEKKIVGRGMHHGVMVRHFNKQDDAIFIKERVYFEDGTWKNNIRAIKNPKRSFWITRPGFRNHKEKKEWEYADRLQRFESTEAQLLRNINNALNEPYFQGSMRQRKRSPYLYGLEVPMAGLFKRHYQKTWPDHVIEQSDVAILDTETTTDEEVVDKKLLITSVAHKRDLFMAVERSFLHQYNDPEKALREKFLEILPEYFGEKGEWTLHLRIVDSRAKTAIECIKWLHARQPDWVACWNMAFDYQVIENALRQEGYDVGDIMSDPKIPHGFRYAKFAQTNPVKRTAAGKEMPKMPWEIWSWVVAPASFQWICQMATYHELRKVEGQQDSYKLDKVLIEHLGEGKLIHGFSKKPEGSKAWHDDMQANFPLEYCVYNAVDVIRPKLLDEKTGDLSQAMNVQLGYSDYYDVASNPTRLQQDMYFHALEEEGMITGTVSDQMVDELDRDVVTRRDWVATLDAFLMAEPGENIFTDAPHIVTRIFCHNSDLDMTGTYPNEQNGFNMSKATTRFEVSRVQGVPEKVRRHVGVDSTFPEANALWLAQTLNKFPTPDEWLEQFQKERKKA